MINFLINILLAVSFICFLKAIYLANTCRNNKGALRSILVGWIAILGTGIGVVLRIILNS